VPYKIKLIVYKHRKSLHDFEGSYVLEFDAVLYGRCTDVSEDPSAFIMRAMGEASLSGTSIVIPHYTASHSTRLIFVNTAMRTEISRDFSREPQGKRWEDDIVIVIKELPRETVLC